MIIHEKASLGRETKNNCATGDSKVTGELSLPEVELGEDSRGATHYC